jgi:hypothetical protein
MSGSPPGGGAAAATRKSFRTLFCAARGCGEADYARRVFRECLYPWAAPCVWLCGGYRGGFFAPDRELIEAVGNLTRAAGFDDECAEYFVHPHNHGWLRRVARVRISTRKLHHLVRHLL